MGGLCNIRCGKLGNEMVVIRVGIQLRNYSGPLRYVIEEFDVRIGNRALPRVKKGHLTSIMSRGAGRTSTNVPFRKDDINFLGKRTNGHGRLHNCLRTPRIAGCAATANGIGHHARLRETASWRWYEYSGRK
jgi:hypothetical protein